MGTFSSATDSNGMQLTSDGFIQGSGGGVKIKNFLGQTGVKLFGDVIISPEIQSNTYSESDDPNALIQMGTTAFIIKGDEYLRTRVSTATRFPVAVRSSDEHLVVSASISSIRYKENVESLDVNYKTILEIEPVTFHYKKEVLTEGDPSNKQYGFIAEQVESLGLQELVEYDKENRPDSIKYDNIPIYLLKVCQEQDKIIASLLNRVDQLESRMV